MLLSATPLTLGIAHASMALLSLNRGVQWSMVNGQWSMFNGQWSMVNGQCAMQLVVVSAVTAAVAAAMTIRRIVSQIEFFFIMLNC